MEQNLNNNHLNSNLPIDNKIATDSNLEIMDFDLDEENTTTKAIKDKKIFTKTAAFVVMVRLINSIICSIFI